METNEVIIWKCNADERRELVKLLAWPEEREQLEKEDKECKEVFDAARQFFML